MKQYRLHLVVRGRVQNVYFRASTQEEARRLGVTGWVKNRSDGAVEILAEGADHCLQELLAWAQRGPRDARVDGIDTRWHVYTGEFLEFLIAD